MSEIEGIIIEQKTLREHSGGERIAELLQERLDVAEELYNINRQISMKFMQKEVGLNETELLSLNKRLGEIIKKLRWH